VTKGRATAKPDGAPSNALFFNTLTTYRQMVLARIRELIPTQRYQNTLYGPMFEYPLRQGKGFRPALCLAMCQACGGCLEDALDTAAALEMFHNAFLIHDDVADESEMRRGLPTLHSKYGIGVATNVGDALNMLAMKVLVANTRKLGVERALTIVDDICQMAQQTTQGQAVELDWIRNPRPNLTSRDYLQMIKGKTCWYTTIIPMRVGALIANIPPCDLGPFVPFGYRIGAAFQIQDDILNLMGGDSYGKEIGGDIAEGKRTLIIIHTFQNTDSATRQRLVDIYGKPRMDKTMDEIQFVQEAIDEAGSIEFAREIAARLTLSAKRLFERRFSWLRPGPSRDFIDDMINYMISRRL